jgi:hypothetical protein
MPEISRFYGIAIRMFYQDHAPPHFHAVYGDQELVVGITPVIILEGTASNRVKSMVIEGAAIHQNEFAENWQRCQTGQAPDKIAPLD